MLRPQKKWEHRYQSSDAPVFSPHLCEKSLVPHLVAQLWAGRNQGSRWCRWTARLGDAGSLAYLGRPGFSHQGGIWPPHLKDRSKVWHSSLAVFIILITAGRWEASCVPRFVTPQQFEWVVLETHIMQVYLTCADSVCRQVLDRVWQVIHQSEQQRHMKSVCTTVYSDTNNHHVHHIPTLECGCWTLTSPWPSGPLSDLWVHRPRAESRITSEEDKNPQFGGLHVWMDLWKDKKGGETSLLGLTM